MNRISVFCGSSFGHNIIFEEKANELGEYLALNKTGVVYGGANVGLMGTIADGALNNGGEVIGVIPKFLQEKEIAHTGLTKLIVVDTMLERKTKIDDLSDAYIALPGGFGTLDELFEMLTWAQLGIHNKPIGILNINGYYDFLSKQLETMVQNGFLKDVNRKMLLLSDDIPDLYHQMKNYKATDVQKWIK